MKIEADYSDIEGDRGLVIKEVYRGAYIETRNGNRIGFCMRDDTIELNVIPKDSPNSKWFRVNMEELTVDPMASKDAQDLTGLGGTLTEPAYASDYNYGEGSEMGRLTKDDSPL
jgi:hypothetical protein